MKLGPMGYLFVKKKKVPNYTNKNLHICSNIYTPYSIRLTHVEVYGVCFLADCLRSAQKWPVVGSSFGWLIYLWALDIYVSIMSLVSLVRIRRI